jgi:hypothetical protein
MVWAALDDLVDGEHFFDVLSHDVIYEVRYNFAGWPRTPKSGVVVLAHFRAAAMTSDRTRLTT